MCGNKIVSIHQAEFLPWLGFFYKLQLCDTFILYDLAQYNKQDYQNRNNVKIGQDINRITVPVKSHSSKSKMNEIMIDNSGLWQNKIKNQFKTWYYHSHYYDEIMPLFEHLWSQKWEKLFDLNFYLIKTICNYLNINTKIIPSSILIDDISIFDKLSVNDKNLILCLKSEGNIYISGYFGLNYIDKNLFNNNKIKVFYTKNTYPECNSSIIDYLFNYGRETNSLINSFGSLVEY